ncbi:hypothetical protein F4808DRAFT_170914 [Astrocystis sublimbata]|nr:hypothetical protein F4808DRAFT_170914 [Astrocystis sublimbata]
MSTVTETVIQRAIRNFQRNLTDQQKSQFALSSETDVINEVQRIQNRYGSPRKLRSLNRLSKFLEAMSQIEQLIQIFLNVSNTVAFVWGPIKFALLVAANRLETLECLLDTYIEVGEVIPSLRQYEKIFQTAPVVLEVLERYFCDILEFHRNALEVFSSPTWKVFFDSTWRTFKTKFRPILESLKRHRTLLLDERLNAAVMEIQTSRSNMLMALDGSAKQSVDHFTRLDVTIRDVFVKLSEQLYGLQETFKEHEEQMRNTEEDLCVILNKIDPPDFEGDHISARNLCHSGSGQWIFETPTFNKWAQSKSIPDAVLFINGMPGAGKTLMASTIINKVRTEVGNFHTTCLFFYFKQSSDAKRSMECMLRAFLAQLLSQDKALIPAFREKCNAISNTEARRLQNLQIWTVELLKSQNACTIVLDGLDECHEHNNGESRAILKWLLSSVLPDCEREGAIIRLLVLGQRDGDLDDVLSDYPSIRIDMQLSHSKDLKSFTQKRAAELGVRFGLDFEEEQDIVRRVTDTAKGMFLYARVVMDNLVSQGSATELEEELQTKFPAGLDQAYERVVFRILDCPTRPEKQRQATSKILRWLTCASRPLRWNEIQCLFCIDPHLGVCNPKQRRVDSCKTICGSFVDVDDADRSLDKSLHSNPVVNLVHQTARRYLIQTGRVNIVEENAHMTLWSSAYLTSLLSDAKTPSSEIRQKALSGYYGLEDYAVCLFQTQIAGSLEMMASLSATTAQSLRHLYSHFMEHFDPPPNKIEEDSPGISKDCFENNGLDALGLVLERVSGSIRDITEEIRPEELDHKAKDIFLSLHGAPQYRCRKLKCLMFSCSFENKKSRDFHLRLHTNQFTCATSGCPRRTVGFSSSVDLHQHEKEVHTITPKQLELFPPVKKLTDIWSACSRGDLEFVKSFHARGGDLNTTKNPNGYLTPIVLAARSGHSHICEFLGVHGCYAFNHRTYNTEASALAQAIKMANKELFKVLLDSATEENIQKFLKLGLYQHLASAAHSGIDAFWDTLEALRINNGQDLEEKQLLNKLVRHQSRYNPNAVNRLEKTFGLLSQENKKEFLTRRDRQGRSELYWACCFKSENVVAFLLQHMDIEDIYPSTQDDETPISQAIRKYDVAILNRLVQHDPVNSVRAFNSTRNTPMHYACQEGKPEIVEVLLPHCEHSLNEPNALGDTALHLAVGLKSSEAEMEQSSKIVKLLLNTEKVDVLRRNGAEKMVFDLETTPDIRELLQPFKPSTTDAAPDQTETGVISDENLIDS